MKEKHQKTLLRTVAGGITALFTLGGASLCLRPTPVNMPPVFDPAAPKPADCTADKPTLGVVFTGTEARVRAGFRALQNEEVDQLFVSGVGTKLSAKPLANKFGINLNDAESERVVLDRQATDTLSNAANTVKYIAEYPPCRVVLMTSDDHMQRSVYLTQQAMKLLQVKTPLLIMPVNDHEPRWKHWFKERVEDNKLWFIQKNLSPSTLPMRLPASPRDSLARSAIAPNFG